MDTLNRSNAPFPLQIWKAIDEAAVSAARDQLTARRFLDLEGPFGVGLTAIEVGNDDYCRQPEPDEAGAIMGRAIPLPMIRKSFRLSIRRVAAYIENGQPLDLSPAQDAAEAVADREEEMIYQGTPSFGLYGLMTIDGRQQVDGGNWTDPERALQDVLTQHRIDLVCLAGFMRLLTPWFVGLWPARMLNIHPALLPSFKGLDTHRRALEAGVKLHGATVHFVVPEMDSGPIIAQGAVPLHDDDTEAVLAARVLAVEHRLYPLALSLVAAGRVSVVDGRCRVEGASAPDTILLVPGDRG